MEAGEGLRQNRVLMVGWVCDGGNSAGTGKQTTILPIVAESTASAALASLGWRSIIGDRRGLRRGHVVGGNGGSRLIVVWEKRREMVVTCKGHLLTTEAVSEASTEYFSSKF